MLCCCCPWLSNSQPECARLIEENYRTAEYGEAILEPAIETSGGKGLTIRPSHPIDYLHWSEEQIRSVGSLLHKVLMQIEKDKEYPIVIGRSIPRNGFLYEVAIFSSEPRWDFRSIVYASVYGGDPQDRQARENLHRKYCNLPGEKPSGMLTMPIGCGSIEDAFKVMTYRKIDVFMRNNFHLILVTQETVRTDFSIGPFFELESLTQKIIRAVLANFERYSWVTYFDPEAESLTKHLHFFVMPKQRAHLEGALFSEVQTDNQRFFVETVQGIFRI